MKNILIGSRSLDYWLDAGIVKPGTDWDVISESPIEGCEWHDPCLLSNHKFSRYTDEKHIVYHQDRKFYVCDLKGLSIIKRSHLHRDLSWQKHITHYHKYLIDYRTTYKQTDWNLLLERTRLTEKQFPQQGPNLNQTVEDFFDDAVVKKHDHDYLHSLFAYLEKPMYTKLQTDSSKAWCERALWESLSYTQRVLCVAEETYVIATERFLVPNNWDYNKKVAYNKALQKVCTTLTKGWFRDFAIENYPEVQALFNKPKIDKVQSILEGI
jgi:hypothetical protein